MILNNKKRNAHTKVKHRCLLTALRDCVVQLSSACLSTFSYPTLVVHSLLTRVEENMIVQMERKRKQSSA